MSSVEDLKNEIRSADGMVDHLIENSTRQGPAADRLADIPPQVFDGLDIKKLNYAYLPPDMGGLPMLPSGVARRALMEMLGFADAALAVALPGPGLALPPILGLANSYQRAELLSRFNDSRPVWGAFAMTEPAGGSDAANIEMTARREGEGFILDGEKCLIGNGGRAVSSSSTQPLTQRAVDLGFSHSSSTAAALLGSKTAAVPMLGLRAVRVARLRFADCWIPADRLLGDPDAPHKAGAFMSAQRTWEYMRPGLSAVIIGSLERLLSELEKLAEGNGSSTLRSGAASLISRVRPQAGSARLLAHHAAALFDRNEDSAVISSMAKVTAANLAMATAREAMLLVASAGLQEERAEPRN